MAYDLELWFIRSILFIGIARNLGPKLVMIRKMVIDFRRRKKKNFFWFILNTTVDKRFGFLRISHSYCYIWLRNSITINDSLWNT